VNIDNFIRVNFLDDVKKLFNETSVVKDEYKSWFLKN